MYAWEGGPALVQTVDFFTPIVGYDKLAEAGTALLGGHTVQDSEIKFGYAVTGAVDATRVLTNAGARPGDVLILTKPLGTGVVGTAIKAGRVDPVVTLRYD